MLQICTLQRPTREASPGDIRVPEQAPQVIVDLMAACRNHNPKDRPSIGAICALLEELETTSATSTL